jgi:uncharacterized membrane protein YjdF
VGIILFSVLIIKLDKKYNFSVNIYLGLTLLNILHQLGGGLIIKGFRLYSFYIIPELIRVDKIVHFIGGIIITLILYNLLKLHLKRQDKIIYLLIVLMGIGAGAIWEIFEFFTYLSIPETGVGRYINNLGDLIADGLGALVCAGYIWIKNRKLNMS